MPDFFNRRNYLVLLVLILISMLILTIHFREGENGIIHRMQRLVMTAVSPIQGVVTTAVSPIGDGWDYLVHFGDLKRENRKLKQEVSKLKGEVFALRGLKNENARLQGLVGFKNQGGYETIAAHVIGMPTSNWWSSVVIDKGFVDGVRRNMPVIAGGGLVGQVAEVSRDASKIMLLNDAQSGVSVQVQQTGEVGIIKGQLRGENLALRFISRDSSIAKGDVIVTSGLGGLFPKGIYVGKVASVKQSALSLYKIVEVAPATDFSQLEEVLIIKNESGFAFKEGN